MLKMNLALGMVLLGISGMAWALPPCLDNSRRVMDLNNEQVLSWRQQSRDQFHARGYVKGTLTRDYPDHTGHTHFEMQIGPNSDDTIEVVYNQSFGELPPLNPGMEVEVCGDYNTTANQGHGSSKPARCQLRCRNASSFMWLSYARNDGYKIRGCPN